MTPKKARKKGVHQEVGKGGGHVNEKGTKKTELRQISIVFLQPLSLYMEGAKEGGRGKNGQ